MPKHQALFYFMMDQEWLNQFRDKLDKHHAWPSLYTFKFIVPKGKEDEVKRLFPQHFASERQSKNGNYTSITLQMMAQSSEAVIEVYVAVSTIEGIIAL